MKKSIFLSALLCSLFLQAQKKELVWAEEFNSPTLDSNIWNFSLGDGCPELCGWGNRELQLYTKTNHRLEEGMLYIKAEKIGNEYRSTKIHTKGKKRFQYGRFEIRAKLATGQGIWPAFWLLGNNIDQVGWPLCGEIDVLEYVGRAPGEIFTSLHTKAGHGDYASTKTTPIPNIEEGFHLYAVDWDQDRIQFFVDDVLVYTFAPEERTQEVWPFDQEFYLLLNLAIGGHFGGEVDDDIFPQEFVIDFIRVYQ